MVDNNWSLPSASNKAKYVLLSISPLSISSTTATTIIWINVPRLLISYIYSILSRIRFVHLIANLGEMDIFLNTTKIQGNLNYRQLTDYIEVDIRGDDQLYDLAGYLSGTDDTRPLFSTIYHLQPGNIYTIFGEGVYTSPQSNNIQTIARVDYTPPPNCYIKFIHASPDLNAVDILINNQARFFGMSFSQSSAEMKEDNKDNNNYVDNGYIALSPGAYSFKVVPTGQLSPVYIQLDDLVFAAGSYHTLLISGTVKSAASPLQLIELDDDNTMDGDDTHIKLRFVHLSPDSPAIDVRLNGVETFKNLTYEDVTQYIHANTDSYEIEVFPASNSMYRDHSSLLSKETFDWKKLPGVYTVIAEGMLYEKNDQPFKLYAYRDAGLTPPTPPPGPNPDKKKKGGLSKGIVIAILILWRIYR